MQDRGERAGAPSSLLGLLLLAVYALWLFVPPPPLAPSFDAPDARLLERLFPGVPGWWVAGRLLALALGATLLVRLRDAPDERVEPVEYARPVPALRFHLALVAALALLAAAFAAEQLSRELQFAYAGALWLPVVILGWRRPAGPRPAGGGPSGRAGRSIGAVIGVWLLWRGFVSWNCLRAADLVDMWEGLEGLEQALAHGQNLLTASRFVLQPDTNPILQGLPLVELGLLPLSAELVQASQLLWLALAGALVGLVVARRVSATAAPVATAALLFSPFCLMLPIQTGSTAPGPAFCAAALLALDSVVHRRSPAAAVGLALLLGISPWQPAGIPLTALASLVGLVCVVRSFPKRAELLLVALLVLVAAALPGWQNRISPDFFEDVASDYASGRTAWPAGEWLLYGQGSLADIPVMADAGRSGPLDLPLASLLAPFAIPRTPMRLVGDALLDPVGGALAALGIVACLRRARRRRAAAFLLAALAATLVTGFLSSYDRPSLTRLSALPVVMALLAGLGFQSQVRRLPTPAAWASLAATAAIAAGGALLFDGVNPTILPRSALGIAIERIEQRPPAGGAVLLRPDLLHEIGWRHTERIASWLPREPIPVWPVARLDGLGGADPDDELPELFFWSPRLEADAGVAGRICRARPEAAIYLLRDPTGITRSFAARPGGPGWDPGLPPARWTISGCQDPDRDSSADGVGR